MMIVSVTRNPADVVAIRQSGIRTTLVSSVSAGVDAAQRPEVKLIVCDAGAPGLDASLAGLRRSGLPCPLLLRHDLNRHAIQTLYEVAEGEADIRPSFRAYDDLRARLAAASQWNDANATCAILRALGNREDQRVRVFVGVMAVLGERPVMQTTVAKTLGVSVSSFRRWLVALRSDHVRLPDFPTINAHFVVLHLVWRRERLSWAGKRSAGAAGFADDKACGNYVRYHLGRTTAELLRSGGFDARVTAAVNLFATTASARDRYDAIRRI